VHPMAGQTPVSTPCNCILWRVTCIPPIGCSCRLADLHYSIDLGAFFIQRLRCSFNVRWASIQSPCHLVSSLSNLTKPSPTPFMTISIGWRSLLWPCRHVNSATSVFAVSKAKPRLSALSTLALAHPCSCAGFLRLTMLITKL